LDRKEIVQWMLALAFLANLAAYQVSQQLLARGLLEANPLYNAFGLKVEPSLVLLGVVIVVWLLYKVAVRARRTETRAMYGFIVGVVLAFTLADLLRDLTYLYGFTAHYQFFSWGFTIVLAVAIGAYASALMVTREKR